MPHAFRVFRQLRALGFAEPAAIAISSEIETARSEYALFNQENIADRLFDAGLTAPQSEAFADLLRNCFESERFGPYFARTAHKTALVRAGISAADAEQILTSIAPCVFTLTTQEKRIPFTWSPGPGRVVMCDFRHLKVPEMQKERRAIVLSPRLTKDPGRVTVVPVSMKPAVPPEPSHFEFVAGSYECFSPDQSVWALCDHVYTVALTRLWQVNIRRKPTIPSISPADLASIRTLVTRGVGA